MGFNFPPDLCTSIRGERVKEVSVRAAPMPAVPWGPCRPLPGAQGGGSPSCLLLLCCGGTFPLHSQLLGFYSPRGNFLVKHWKSHLPGDWAQSAVPQLFIEHLFLSNTSPGLALGKIRCLGPLRHDCPFMFSSYAQQLYKAGVIRSMYRRKESEFQR